MFPKSKLQNHSLYLKNDGTLWAFGLNDYGHEDGTTTNGIICTGFKRGGGNGCWIRSFFGSENGWFALCMGQEPWGAVG